MKIFPLLFLVALPLTVHGGVVEDFSQLSLNKFPRTFRTYPFQRDKAERVYRVQEEGENRYLAADDKESLSIQIFRKFLWELKKNPSLSWRWRARILPEGANEMDPSKNDSACGVYVPFGGYSGKVIKYIWSTRVPVTTEIRKKPGRSYSIVKNSGTGKRWETVTVNVVEDYRRLFHEEPRQNPPGIGILTDGNATHSPAACDYDDFEITEEASKN